MVNLVGQISSKKMMAVSDDEFTPLLEKFVKMGFVGIMMLFFLYFFNCKNFPGKCENHGVKKIERWVKEHNGKKDDQSVYKADFR